MVEGTSELQDSIAISRNLADKSRDNPAGKYPEVLHELSPEKVLELGELNEPEIALEPRPRLLSRLNPFAQSSGKKDSSSK